MRRATKSGGAEAAARLADRERDCTAAMLALPAAHTPVHRAEHRVDRKADHRPEAPADAAAVGADRVFESAERKDREAAPKALRLDSTSWEIGQAEDRFEARISHRSTLVPSLWRC